jgi:hypothetical protein
VPGLCGPFVQKAKLAPNPPSSRGFPSPYTSVVRRTGAHGHS